MKLLMCLTICCFAIRVESQTLFQTQYPYIADKGQVVWGQDPLYDTRPNYPNLSKTTLNPKQQNIGWERETDVPRKIHNVVTIQPSRETSAEKNHQFNIDSQASATKESDFSSILHTTKKTPSNSNGAKSKVNGLSLAVTDFGINLLKQIDGEIPGNVVMSPYSIINVLALLQQGATGETLNQLTAALQMSQLNSAESFYGFTEDLKKRSTNSTLKTANNIFVGNTFSLNSAVKQTAIRSFGSDVTPINFGNPELATKDINSWVAANTNNKIKQLLPSGTLSYDTRLVLVSAIFFKGLWQIPFRTASTKPFEFSVSRGVSKTTPFMRTRRYFKTGVDLVNNAQVIILPFEHDFYSLMLILPNETSSISAVLSSLTATRLASYHDFSAKDVELKIPKFTVKADTDLVPVLSKMGISNIFGQYAELSGLTTSRANSPQVSSALHSAVLSIDEEGGSAAAATSFAVVALSYDVASVTFTANRPFLAVLWDNKMSLPLFVAKIVDPSL